jgi:hypothetical protein
MKFNRETEFPAHQKVKLHVTPQNLQGKTLVITGGNSGMFLILRTVVLPEKYHKYSLLLQVSVLPVQKCLQR